MNKNTLIGLLLIGVILFGFSWYNNKQYQEQQAVRDKQAREQFVRDSTARANAPRPEVIAPSAELLAADSLRKAQEEKALGEIARAKTGTQELTTLENDLFVITFSNRGGRIAAVELKDYKKYGGDPLMLFTDKGSKFGLQLYIPELINTGDLYFTLANKTENSISYRLAADSANYIEFNYAIQKDNYMMDFSVDLSHFKGRLAQNQPDIKLDWNIVSPQEEKGFQNENQYTTVAYRFPGVDGIEELGVSDKDKSEEIPTKVEWVAFKQQFFSSIIVYKDGFVNNKLAFNTFPPTDKNIKDFSAQLTLPYTPETMKYDFNLYFGPNKFTTLNSYEGMYFEKLVPLGWGIFGWVNRWLVIPIFDFLSKYIVNMGIIILILTLIIKIIILPLTYKSYLSTAKMRLLKPDIEKLSEKYPKKEDAMKKQQAMMELYKKAGVSPMGGCIPMLIQLPILFAMFRFFPTAIELRGKSFLWAEDLSSYDSIWTFPDGFSIPFYGDHISLFTLLMAISLYLTSKINYAQQPMSSNQMPGMKFMMLYMMPIMLLLWFNNYSAGLSWYYLLSNIITLGQTYLFRFAVSDDKLHQQMKENAKKPVKKSKWAERIEQMQKQAQAQQSTNQQARNKKK